MAAHRVKFRWDRADEAAIGQGRFGTVYLGSNLDTGEAVAVKQLHLSDEGCEAAEANEALRQLEREISLVKGVTHANVVEYFGTESRGGIFST